jgi:peptidoglycan/LPS O-acetylase OafA/YrhL
MIQRIQSIWLLIVAIAAFFAYESTIYIGKTASGSEIAVPLASNLLLAITIVVLGVLAILCIFLFKNRKLQFRLSVLGIIFSLVLLILIYMVVESAKTDRGLVTGSYRIGALIPVVMAVFFFLASRGIYKDQKLVKSLNRLR